MARRIQLGWLSWATFCGKIWFQSISSSRARQWQAACTLCASGGVGALQRDGQSKVSNACGAAVGAYKALMAKAATDSKPAVCNGMVSWVSSCSIYACIFIISYAKSIFLSSRKLVDNANYDVYSAEQRVQLWVLGFYNALYGREWSNTSGWMRDSSV